MDNPKSAPARKYTLKTAHPSPAQTTYVVKSSAARMPASCWGTYRRVAVLEVVRGTTPRMISTRATGVVRVVETWERRSVGSSTQCAYQRAMREAAELAAELNRRSK